MVNFTYLKMIGHVGHNIECVTYGIGDDIDNVAIECIDCGVVIVDENNESIEE